MFVFVLLYGGGIKDKCINEHLERNSLCLLVSVTASRAQTPSLTQMTWLMEGEVSVRSGALPGAAVCLGWQQRSPKGPSSHTSAGKAREGVVLPSVLLLNSQNFHVFFYCCFMTTHTNIWSSSCIWACGVIWQYKKKIHMITLVRKGWNKLSTNAVLIVVNGKRTKKQNHILTYIWIEQDTYGTREMKDRQDFGVWNNLKVCWDTELTI